MDREKLVDEVLMLLPVLGRGVGRPSPVEMEDLARQGVPVELELSPGHVQVLISLARGPVSIGRLAEEAGVSQPAASQLVDRLVGHGVVERHHGEADRRVVMVDYVPEMRRVARGIVEHRRERLEEVMGTLDDGEFLAFVKGLRALVRGFEGPAGEEEG